MGNRIGTLIFIFLLTPWCLEKDNLSDKCFGMVGTLLYTGPDAFIMSILYRDDHRALKDVIPLSGLGRKIGSYLNFESRYG
jgi:hypothetical protein